MHDTSPAARALLVLELIQGAPGITADRLADRLGLTDRAIRRHVGILREAGIPVESTRGRYGGYRIGRGLRLPPLMFSPPEALGLVMAVLEGHGEPGEGDPVATALGKLVRALPESLAGPVGAIAKVSGRGQGDERATPEPEILTALVRACALRTPVRIGYRRREERPWDVDPWAVVVRRGRWFLLCFAHRPGAVRTLRVDRVTAVEVLPGQVEPPDDLDPYALLEESLAQGWTHEVEVEIDAPIEYVGHWLSRSVGRLERIDDQRTRLVGTTDEPDWYAYQLCAIRAPFRVLGSEAVRDQVAAMGRHLLRAADPDSAT